MKAFLIAALVAGSVPALAASDFNQAADTATEQEAVTEGLIPADQLDAPQYQTEFVAADRHDPRGPGHDQPGRDPRGPGHDQPGRDPRDPRGPGHDQPGRDHGRDHGGGWHRPRPMPPRQQWQCVARDRIQRSYRGSGWDVNEARRQAMYSCQSRSIIGRCRLVGCGRF